MTRAAAALAQSLRSSGARRIAFLGLAKNAGKTTALTAVLAELHRLGVVAGATSAGRDGEEFDAITGEFRSGRLLPLVDSVFDISQGRQAFERLQSGNQFGKIVVRIPD